MGNSPTGRGLAREPTIRLGACPKSRALPGEQPRLLRVDEAAEVLTISGRHLRGLIARGEVNVVGLGRCLRVPRAEVDRLCETGGLGR